MRLPDLRILNGQNDGEAQEIQTIDKVAIYGIAVDGAIDVEVSPDGGTSWYSLASAVADGARTLVDPVHATHMRLVSDAVGGETADRSFPCHGSTLEVV